MAYVPGVQPELVAANGRRFPGFATAVFAFIVDPATRRFLLLSSPAKRARPGWEVIGGGLEEGETLLAGLAREVAEEVGPDVRLRVLGTVHAWSFRYDDRVTHLTSTAFVASYLGGEVVPCDDMAGSAVRWAGLEEIRELAASDTRLIPGPAWLFERALQCFDLWSAHDPADLPGWETGEPPAPIPVS
jgi:8-oxo-dGTP pyrophosphatase MutT (NUDIX family)